MNDCIPFSVLGYWTTVGHLDTIILQYERFPSHRFYLWVEISLCGRFISPPYRNQRNGARQNHKRCQQRRQESD